MYIMFKTMMRLNEQINYCHPGLRYLLVGLPPNPGAVDRSEACSLGMQAAPSSIPKRHILSWRLGHENISTAILPLPLIQEEQLSVTGKECALSTGKLPRRLAQEQAC